MSVDKVMLNVPVSRGIVGGKPRVSESLCDGQPHLAVIGERKIRLFIFRLCTFYFKIHFKSYNNYLFYLVRSKIFVFVPPLLHNPFQLKKIEIV